MKNNNNNNNNGKVEVTTTLDKETNDRLSTYVDDTGKSVNSAVREFVTTGLDSIETKAFLSKGCQEGDLRENSRTCKSLDHHDN